MLLTAVPLAELHLSGLPACVAQARDETVAALGDLVDEHVADRVLLLVSELVTNAVTHAHTAVLVQVWAVGGQVQVHVHDGVFPYRQLQRCATLGVGRGWGLRLVDTLATRWGVQGEPTGKYVWFHVAVPPVGQPGLNGGPG